MTENQSSLTEVNVPTGEITLPSIDVSKYVGRKTKIASAKTCKNAQGKYLLRIETEVVDTITGGKTPIQIRGSVLLGLHEDAEGNIGWGVDTKAGKFMAKYKANQPKDLVGKEVQLQRQATNDKFLTFV
jgi:hypothetical protein